MTRTVVGPICWHLVMLALFMATDVLAQPPDWPYQTDFDDYLLHVHPELNYALHPDWLDDWERTRLGPGAFRGVFGSSATDELLVDAHWSLNPLLSSGGLRLRQDIVWQERRHLPHDRLDLWLGFEQRVHGGLALVAQATPAEAKETIDLRFGGLWATADRAQYVQVLWLAEDLVRDEKDDRKPSTTDTSRGVSWALRLARGPWSVASEGRWTGGAVRDYPDAAASPDLRGDARRDDHFVVRGRWRPGPRTHVEVAWQQAEQGERRHYRGDAAAYDHDYSGWYRNLSMRALVPLSTRWRARGELHRLDRRATVSGWRAFGYRRDEVLPGLWAEWQAGGGHTVELGYLGTFYHWRYAGEEPASGFADKVELATVFRLNGGARLKLSLSHEVSLERFGGASVRLVTGFGAGRGRDGTLP